MTEQNYARVPIVDPKTGKISRTIGVALRAREDVDNLSPAEIEIKLRELGSRRLTPAEFWQTYFWAKQDCPQLYGDVTNRGYGLELLDGEFIPLEQGSESNLARLITNVKYQKNSNGIFVAQPGQEHAIRTPRVDEYSAPGKSGNGLGVNFNPEDIDYNTGFPIRSNPKGDFGINYSTDAGTKNAIVFRCLDSCLEIGTSPEEQIDPGILGRLRVREVKD